MKDGRQEGKHSSEGPRRPAGQRLSAVRPRYPPRALPEAGGPGRLAATYRTGAAPPGRARWPQWAPAPALPASAPCTRALDCGAGSAPRSAVLCRSTFTTVTCPRSKPRRRSGYTGQERQARRRPRGRDRRPGPGRYLCPGWARVSLWREDSWLHGSKAKARTPCPDFQPGLLPTLLLPWLLALLNAASRCGVLECHLWDQVQGH